MAYDPRNPVARPEILDLTGHYLPTSDPRLHWYDSEHPVVAWTAPGKLASTILEVTCHWEDGPAPIPAGKALSYYLGVVGAVAQYHAWDRDWLPDIPGVQHVDGIAYHYAITPPDDHGHAHILQVSPETLRTANAFAANVHNLAVVVLAGRHDVVYPATQAALRAVLDWLTRGRPDLPGVTRFPTKLVADGRVQQTYGVSTHDECLKRQGRPVKGCCGLYAQTVRDWRAGIAL